MRHPGVFLYPATPLVGRKGLQESPTTAIVFERFSSSAMGSVWGGEDTESRDYFLLAASNFCLYIFRASLRMVSETSLLALRFFRSAISRFFIRPRPRSSGVRGFATRLRTTM